MKVIRQCEANVELDGPEVVRTYLETGKITFGSSTLLPGQTGGTIRDIRNLTKCLFCEPWT